MLVKVYLPRKFLKYDLCFPLEKYKLSYAARTYQSGKERQQNLAKHWQLTFPLLCKPCLAGTLLLYLRLHTWGLVFIHRVYIHRAMTNRGNIPKLRELSGLKQIKGYYNPIRAKAAPYFDKRKTSGCVRGRSPTITPRGRGSQQTQTQWEFWHTSTPTWPPA